MKIKANLNLRLSVKTEDLEKELGHPPTLKDIKAHFNNRIENLAGSNDGSEMLANCIDDFTLEADGVLPE